MGQNVVLCDTDCTKMLGVNDGMTNGHASIYHHKASLTSLVRWKVSLTAILTGVALLVLLPYVHLGVVYRWWVPHSQEPDRDRCHCNCWDTLFKGTYESSENPGYKHVYFNITSNTFKIWALSVVAALAFYECVCYLVRLALQHQLRFLMLVLFCSVVYPHYYSWWMYFNALNDDFYKQWNHQTFFSLTELVSTFTVVWLCNSQRPIQPRLLLLIMDIAMLHILASGADQFVVNVFLGEGKWHQRTRDLALMLPDLLHLLIPALELHWYRTHLGRSLRDCFTIWDVLCSVLGVAILWLTCTSL